MTADVIVKLFEQEVDGIEPFRREAEQWFKMDSPHVVKLLAASHCSSPAPLVVEDVKGVTLKQHLSNPNHFHEIWAKVRQVAEGLTYLRKQRMVHGNLKPSNLLVDKNGTAKMGDFGRGIATLQNLVIIAGNGEAFLRWRAPEYRSPDQRPTYMSDVYSLGLCILDMLVPNFEPPHDGQLHRLNGIKDDAWSLVVQMCALEPTDRIDLSEVIEKLKLLDKASVKVLVHNIPSEPDIPGNSIQITPISSVTVCGQIGEGSHACIHRADWKGAEVVAKCAPIKSDADKQAFDREMNIWRKVQPHPHVLPLYGIRRSDSQCIAFCEFAADGSLDKYLSKNGRARIWQKLLQATIGVKHLHAYFVIHNDIKCNNFMVRGDGQVMIADFDLSLIVNEPPPQVANLNPRWRAPECIVAGGAGPSFASDVYSLGMCILEAITGKAPWGRLPDSAVRYHLKNQEPLNRPSTISDAEWELVPAMIKYKPEERITLDDVVKQLKQLADAEEFPSTQTS